MNDINLSELRRKIITALEDGLEVRIGESSDKVFAGHDIGYETISLGFRLDNNAEVNALDMRLSFQNYRICKNEIEYRYADTIIWADEGKVKILIDNTDEGTVIRATAKLYYAALKNPRDLLIVYKNSAGRPSVGVRRLKQG